MRAVLFLAFCTVSRALENCGWNNQFDSVTTSIAVHHNGNSEPCGLVKVDGVRLKELLSRHGCEPSKFAMETVLTDLLASQQVCGDVLDFCDMGENRTVIHEDHDDLIKTNSGTLPCRWFTREGLRVSSVSLLDKLVSGTDHGSCDQETCQEPMLHLYGVPAGRMFMFAASHVGETFELDHVRDSEGKIIKLEVLSTSPRVFQIENFFNQRESDEILQKALDDPSEVYGFHRSTTGTSGASVYNRRTSENAWDTNGETARQVKERGFSLLGIDEFLESHSDGLQILRYNLTKAYIPHMDYLDDRGNQESYDYDSAGKGGNRFATILLYFTDLEDGAGGETVFPKAWPPNVAEEDRVSTEDAIQQLRKEGSVLEHGSWEEEMAAQCRTRLAVQPRATSAVLFYSQHPDGTEDKMSQHGGCPVLRGTKFAANLWTWSGIRPEFPGAPYKFAPPPKAAPVQKSAKFVMTNDCAYETAEVFYETTTSFGVLGKDKPPINVNTYLGHRWNIKVDGEIVKSFTVGDDAVQVFEL